MVELGDLREGILPADIEPTLDQIIYLEGVRLVGIGTNLACFGAIRPTQAKMQKLAAIASRVMIMATPRQRARYIRRRTCWRPFYASLALCPRTIRVRPARSLTAAALHAAPIEAARRD